MAPTVSIALVVYNEEKRIKKVLDNIFNLDYPHDKLEVIVMDDGSKDRTVEIAKKYPVKVIVNEVKDAEVNLLKAFKISKGKYFTFTAGDMFYCTKHWLKLMVKPLEENPDIVQSATRYYRHPKDSIISQYISLDPLQRDPIYRFFSPSLEDMIKEKRDGYYVTEYSSTKIPPQNAGVYRTSVMRGIYKDKDRWMDLDQFCILIEKGFTKFAYVPQAGFYHFHVDNLIHLLKKRYRNLTKIYLPQLPQRRYKWFSLDSPRDLIKMILWIIIANSFFPLFIRSLFRSITERTYLHLLDAPVALILTDFILFHFLASTAGRKEIYLSLGNLLDKRIK